MDAAHTADQILTAGAALAGLILVFMGNVLADFGHYTPDDQSVVRGKFLWRGWLAFAGFTIALLAALAGLAYNWYADPSVIDIGIVLLVASFICVFVSALIQVRDI